jgi:hypothetical protein
VGKQLRDEICACGRDPGTIQRLGYAVAEAHALGAFLALASLAVRFKVSAMLSRRARSASKPGAR